MFMLQTVLILLCVFLIIFVIQIIKFHNKYQKLTFREYQRKMAMNGIIFEDLCGNVALDSRNKISNTKIIENKSLRSFYLDRYNGNI